MIQGTTQDHLQIFNIEAKAKLKSYQMPEQVKRQLLKMRQKLQETQLWNWLGT